MTKKPRKASVVAPKHLRFDVNGLWFECSADFRGPKVVMHADPKFLVACSETLQPGFCIIQGDTLVKAKVATRWISKALKWLEDAKPEIVPKRKRAKR